MEFSLLAVIGIGLAAMFFGYFFGLFEGRGQGYKKGKQEGTAEAVRTAEPPAPPPARVAPAVAQQPTERPLLKLSMDANQRPCLDLDGERIDTTQIDPPQRRRLIDLMVIMRPWIEGGPVGRPQPTAAPAAPAAQPAPPAPRAAVPPAPPAVSAPVTVGATVPPTSEPVAPTTMVGQIDAILQTRLAGTPLANRGIRLVESPQGGALVVVGMQRYAGVGDVPDPEVQSVIRAAIAEWEKKYTPG